MRNRRISAQSSTVIISLPPALFEEQDNPEITYRQPLLTWTTGTLFNRCFWYSIISVLTTDTHSNINGYDLAPAETGIFVIKSHSKSGRCVGPADPEGYTLHYWLNFEAEDGQRMTEYYTTTLSGQEE